MGSTQGILGTQSGWEKHRQTFRRYLGTSICRGVLQGTLLPDCVGKWSRTLRAENPGRWSRSRISKMMSNWAGTLYGKPWSAATAYIWVTSSRRPG